MKGNLAFLPTIVFIIWMGSIYLRHAQNILKKKSKKIVIKKHFFEVPREQGAEEEKARFKGAFQSSLRF